MEKTTIVYKNGRPYVELIEGAMRITAPLPLNFTKEELEKTLERIRMG
jgi:hypothetical protein